MTLATARKTTCSTKIRDVSTKPIKHADKNAANRLLEKRMNARRNKKNQLSNFNAQKNLHPK